MIRILAACALLSTPAAAEMLDGADDPAFQAALTALLASDDAAAVATLRDLAEGGNTAALVTLPFALDWVPPQGNLKEKNAQRKVGGVTAQDAAAKAHNATALWNRGDTTNADDMLDRATGLQAAGEPGKAAILLSGWLNQTGAYLGVPPELLSDTAPAWLGGLALSGRMTGAIGRDGPAPEDAALLLSLMREDRLVGWVAYVAMLDSYPEIFNIIGSPLAGTGLSAADTEARIADARAVREVTRWHDETPTSAETATRARDLLQGRAEFLPVAQLCQAHCPGSTATCEAAVLAYPGVPFGYDVAQPFADTLDPLAFAASDRGVALMIRPRKDPVGATDRATAEGLDACYGALLARRDGLQF
jgi:hypothetical protein